MPKLIDGDKKDLGGFSVARYIPQRAQRMVGPFVFFDHIGPATFPAGKGVNVRPHPHIGLATVTYLFEGSMLHRDSLGSVQEIHPGDINWMVAGSGIVHSERETHEVRSGEHNLHGLQLWVALPPDLQTVDPDFVHVSKNDLPCVYGPGVMMRVLLGSAYERVSPVRTFSPMLYVDVLAEKGRTIPHPDAAMEVAVFVITGRLEINGQEASANDFVVLSADDQEIHISEDSRFVLIGGTAFEQKPLVHWNFVAYRPEDIDAARERWENGGFPAIPGDDEEHIPLP